jgi:hypothetical protein
MLLLPQPADLPPANPTTLGGANIPLEDRVELAAAGCYKLWLEGHAVRARDLMEAVPEFKSVYTSPNALGTLLGRGVAGHGLGLFRRGDAYPPTYANGWQLAQRLSPGQFERVAHRLKFASVEDFAAAIRQLPEEQP